jgi:hypothetical protein
MLRWKVRLAGERSEIEDLRQLVDLPEFRISDENNEYFLDSESFNGLTDAGAVRELAERLIRVAKRSSSFPKWRTQRGENGWTRQYRA